MATVTFDTLEYTEQLKAFGVPDDQAKGHAKAISGILQQVEESRLKELATKGDIELVKGDIELAKAELRKEIETAKVETIKWVIATGIVILGGVAAINRLVPPAPAFYAAPHTSQEMRLPALPRQPGDGQPGFGR
ncbi:MAG: hypothetical protein HQL63_15480 [Magnetococcales bacterium]|nr:hypothetical protein [Magnetococcales bacterium]